MPVRDSDWNEILEIFPGLQRYPGALEEFERLLRPAFSNEEWARRAEARRQFTNVANQGRQTRSSPFFELAWLRAKREEPSLDDRDRDLLWQGYFQSGLTKDERKYWRQQWEMAYRRPTDEEADLWYGDSP